MGKRKILVASLVAFISPLALPNSSGALEPGSSGDDGGVPEIKGQQTWNIKTGDATLQANINPHGLETTYQFILYLPCPEAGPGEVSCQGVSVLPLPEKTIPAGQEFVGVSAEATEGGSDLTPGREYEWTVRAENTAGVVFAGMETFLTGRRPSVKTLAASGITETSATLNASITPGSEGDNWGWDRTGSYYQFQLTTDPADFRPELGCPDLSEWEGTSVGCLGPLLRSGLYGWAPAAGSFIYQPTDLPFSFVEGLPSESVSLDLSEVDRALQPETTYYYRVIVVTRLQGVDKIEWEAPPVYGATQTFATPPYPPVALDNGPAETGGIVADSSPPTVSSRGGAADGRPASGSPRKGGKRCSKGDRAKQTRKAKRRRSCKLGSQIARVAPAIPRS